MTFFSAVIGFDYTGKQKDAKSSTLHAGVLVLTNIIANRNAQTLALLWTPEEAKVEQMSNTLHLFKLFLI